MNGSLKNIQRLYKGFGQTGARLMLFVAAGQALHHLPGSVVAHFGEQIAPLPGLHIPAHIIRGADDDILPEIKTVNRLSVLLRIGFLFKIFGDSRVIHRGGVQCVSVQSPATLGEIGLCGPCRIHSPRLAVQQGLQVGNGGTGR